MCLYNQMHTPVVTEVCFGGGETCPTSQIEQADSIKMAEML